MTNSPIPGAISEKRLTEIEVASATVRKPIPGNPSTGVTRGYVYLEPDETLALVSAYRRIEALQRELAEAEAKSYRAGPSVEALISRAETAESQASSARRLALEEAAEVVREEWQAFATARGVTAEALVAIILLRIHDLAPPAAIRDIKGADSSAEVKL